MVGLRLISGRFKNLFFMMSIGYLGPTPISILDITERYHGMWSDHIILCVIWLC